MDLTPLTHVGPWIMGSIGTIIGATFGFILSLDDALKRGGKTRKDDNWAAVMTIAGAVMFGSASFYSTNGQSAMCAAIAIVVVLGVLSLPEIVKEILHRLQQDPTVKQEDEM